MQKIIQGIAAALCLVLLLPACEEPFDKAAALRRANKAKLDRQFPAAIEILEEILAHDPKDVEARFQLGLAHGLNNDPFEARLELMQVIEIDSMRADAYEHLGMLAFGAEDRPEAIERLERAVSLGSRGIQIYDTLQYLHFQEGTIEEAKKWVRRSIQANPRDPRFRLKLATLEHFIGSYEAAKNVLEPLLEVYPDYWDALLLAGKVYRQLGEHEKALEALNKAGQRSEHLKALEALKKGGRRKKGMTDYTHELGMVKLKTGDSEGAVDAFNEVVRFSPEKPEAHYGLGQAYMKLGDREKAKSALERFREMQQNDKALKGKQAKFISNWQAALTKERDGDFEGSLAAFQEALSYKQGDISTQLLVWLVLRNQGDRAEAARTYRQVERLINAQQREFSELTFTLSQRLIKRGFNVKAAEVLNELLLRDPEHKAARYQLVRVYSKLGREEERDAQLEVFRIGAHPEL